MRGEAPCLLLPLLRVKLRGSRGGVEVTGLLRGEPPVLDMVLPCCGNIDELLEPRARPSNCACPPVRDLLDKRTMILVCGASKYCLCRQ